MEPTTVFREQALGTGVHVVGQPMDGVESVAVGFLIGTGARDETPDSSGISHFTEQLLFRGTEHMDARQLSERFDSLGISYDSSTGLEMTLVNGVLLGDTLPAALDLLADCLRFPAFPEDEVESVRTLIMQELRQRDDRPAQRVMDTLRQRFFRDSPCGHDVLGSEESINTLTVADLRRYWEDRYTANNMTLSVAGNVDWERTLEQLEVLTASWPTGRGRMSMEPPGTNPGVTVMHKEAAQENIGFAFPGVPVGDPDYYAAGLAAQVLGGGTNSRLFREVREKRGLAYAVQARFDGLEKTGLFRIYVGTSADRAHESVEVVIDELRSFERSGITDDELKLAKTRLKSQVLMRSESTLSRMAANLRSWWFEHKLYSLEALKEEIDRVTVEQIQLLVGNLGIAENLAAVALGPRSEEQLFRGVVATS